MVNSSQSSSAKPSSAKPYRSGSLVTPPSAAHPASLAASPSAGQLVTLVLAWAGVGLPLAWGVLETLRKTLALFQ